MKAMVKDKKVHITVTYDMTFVRGKRFRFHCFQNFSETFGLFQTSEISDSKYESDGERNKSQYHSYL
jgi:hypothetical protein